MRGEGGILQRHVLMKEADEPEEASLSIAHGMGRKAACSAGGCGRSQEVRAWSRGFAGRPGAAQRCRWSNRVWRRGSSMVTGIVAAPSIFRSR